MRLEILSENLISGVNIACRFLVSRPQIAAFSHLLLRAKPGSLEITASNLETTVVVNVGAKIDEAGEFTVPGKTFQEIVGQLSRGKVSLTTEEGFLTLSGSNFKGKINGMPATEFPKVESDLDSLKPTGSWQLEGETFSQILTRLLFAAATDESRPVLTGVLFSGRGDRLVLTATDGFRLSEDSFALEESFSARFIVPAKALLEVGRLLGEKRQRAEGKERGNGESKLVLDYFAEKNEVVFYLEEIKIISRLISGNFPDYEKIIPSDSNIVVVGAIKELSNAVRLAAVFARESANIVKFKIQDSKIKISANAPEVGENETEVEVKAQKGGEENLVIAFNFRYLLDLFNNLGDEEIVLEFNGPLSASVFRTPAYPHFLHLIMPVRVQD